MKVPASASPALRRLEIARPRVAALSSLGRAAARLERPPRRWIQRCLGFTDIHTQQKWRALWPLLRQLPQSELRVLDAGCGAGRWTIELASRRPAWQLEGVDRDASLTALGAVALDRLELRNARIVTADFLTYEPSSPFDVVLSVASAHYLVESGSGPLLFARFHSWLRGRGKLILLVPRRREEESTVRWLSHPTGRAVFTRTQLLDLVARAGLHVEHLMPHVGLFGALAKQMDWTARRYFPRYLLPLLYPLESLLSAWDLTLPTHRDRSMAWVVVASADGGESLRTSA